MPVRERNSTSWLRAGSEVMSPAADRASCHAEHRQDQSDNHDNDSDRPDNCDVRDESNNEKDDAEDYQFDSHGQMTIARLGYLLRPRTKNFKTPRQR